MTEWKTVSENQNRQGFGVYGGSSLQVLFALHDKTLLSGMELDGVTTCSIEPIHTGSSKVDIFLELLRHVTAVLWGM